MSIRSGYDILGIVAQSWDTHPFSFMELDVASHRRNKNRFGITWCERHLWNKIKLCKEGCQYCHNLKISCIVKKDLKVTQTYHENMYVLFPGDGLFIGSLNDVTMKLNPLYVRFL